MPTCPPTCDYHPVCTFAESNGTGRDLCTIQGGPVFECTRSAREDTLRPGTTGAWTLDETEPYYLDLPLVHALGRFFGESSVIEFGSGKGCYCDALLNSGVFVRGYEGASNVEALTHGLVRHADLTSPRLQLGAADWALCLEVAEHVPKRHEATMLANLHAHNTRGIVLSWSNRKAGVGHVNPRYKIAVTHVMESWNYTEDVEATRTLQAAANYAWFKQQRFHSIMGGGVRVWRRSRGTGSGERRRRARHFG